jgi:hypothetical protein
MEIMTFLLNYGTDILSIAITLAGVIYAVIVMSAAGISMFFGHLSQEKILKYNLNDTTSINRIVLSIIFIPSIALLLLGHLYSETLSISIPAWLVYATWLIKRVRDFDRKEMTIKKDGDVLYFRMRYSEEGFLSIKSSGSTKYIFENEHGKLFLFSIEDVIDGYEAFENKEKSIKQKDDKKIIPDIILIISLIVSMQFNDWLNWAHIIVSIYLLFRMKIYIMCFKYLFIIVVRILKKNIPYVLVFILIMYSLINLYTN